MCEAVCYMRGKQIIITHFTDTKACIPIQTQAGFQLFTWGRRVGESGKLPLGGWIAHELLEKGTFDRYFPKEVKITVSKFLEYDIEGRSIWSEIIEGRWIRGLLLSEKDEQRVYIVIFTPLKPITPFRRWPMIYSD